MFKYDPNVFTPFAFVLAATVGGFRLGLLLMIAVSVGTFACVLALPAHSLHDAHHIDALE